MKREKNKRYRIIMAICYLMLITLSIGVILLGQYNISAAKLFTILFHGTSDESLKTAIFIILQVRIPRVIIAAMVGAGLSISGSALQGTFQNPLVSPDLLGVCSGAGFGAALGILLTGGFGLLTPILSFIFGLCSILLVFFLANTKNQTETLSVVLGGIIISSIFTALIALIKYVGDTSQTLPAITFWQMGSLSNVSYHDIVIAFVPIMSGIVGLHMLRWKINLLSLGDEDCATLGVNPKTTRWLIILFATLTTVGCVMVSGIIGWIGLVIPHICRKLVGVNHGYLLPVSCVIGAIFMVFVDTVARNITSSEIPIGILTALIGAPFFSIIYHQGRKER